MKQLLLAVFIAVFYSSFGQSIDSISFLNSNTPPDAHVYVTLPASGHYLSRSNTLTINDTVYMNLYFKECPGWLVLTPFDSVFTYSSSVNQKSSYHLIKVYRDSNTIDTNCFVHNDVVLKDSLMTHLQLGVDLNEHHIKTDIYPNPVVTQFRLKNLNVEKVRSLNIFSPDGALVKSVGEINDQIVMSELPSGLYIISINYNNGRTERIKFTLLD